MPPILPYQPTPQTHIVIFGPTEKLINLFQRNVAIIA